MMFYKYGACPKCATTLVKKETYASRTDLICRWARLTGHPELLNQDAFGICGMASVVYLLLKLDQRRFDDLFFATFADVIESFKRARFLTAGKQLIKIDFVYLSRQYWNASTDGFMPRIVQGQGPRVKDTSRDDESQGLAVMVPKKMEVHHEFFVDFYVSRALGYLFKKTAEDRYGSEKVQFNTVFDKPGLGYAGGDYRIFTRYGSFGLRTNNLAYILKDVVGATGVSIASKKPPSVVSVGAERVGGVLYEEFSDVDELGRLFVVGLSVPRSFAIAGVYGDIVKDRVTSPRLADAKLPYNHWIVINDFKIVEVSPFVCTCGKRHVKLGIWTWGKIHPVTVCEGVLLSYIQDVIFGHF